jgi:hypothetical protein
MGPLIVIASLVQWVSGIVLAYVILARASQHGRAGRGPRALAGLAIVLFLVGAIELAFVLAGAHPTQHRWLPPDFTAGHWQLITLLLFSAAAWVTILIAALWNGILGVNSRRRIAAAELRRRTDRALHTHHDAVSHARSPGGSARDA